MSQEVILPMVELGLSGPPLCFCNQITEVLELGMNFRYIALFETSRRFPEAKHRSGNPEIFLAR
jgi:hypothetical protein